MRRPILLDTPPPPLPSVRWSRVLNNRYLSAGGLAAGGIAAIVGASAVLAMLMSSGVAPDGSARAAAADVAAPSPVAAKPILAGATSTGVQMVGDVKQPDRPCEEQTWPYIAAHCLKPASSDPKPATAKVAVDRADIKTSRAAIAVPAVPAPAVQMAVAPPVVQAAAPEPAPPMPAARPAARDQAIRDDAHAKRPRTVARNEPRDIRPDARAEARKAYASQPNPPAAVRRATETEYDVPGPLGSTRRVVVIRQQPLHHQAAAFSDER